MSKNKGFSSTLVVLTVILVLTVGLIGYYLYSQNQQTKTEQAATIQAPAEETTSQDTLDTELEAIQLEDLDTQFQEVDQDLQNL